MAKTPPLLLLLLLVVVVVTQLQRYTRTSAFAFHIRSSLKE